MKPIPLVLSSLLAVAAAAPARADLIADFRAGDAIALHAATVDPGGGPRHATRGRPQPKAVGSLDVALPASALGVALPITLHLRGAVLPDGRVEYTLDERFAPAIELGGGLTLTQVTGRLVLRARSLPGTAVHDVGNVRLLLDEPGALTAHGTWGQLAIAVGAFELVGGLAQPSLAGFADPGAAPPCSDRVVTRRTLEVTLTDAARGSGAVVALSTPRAGVHLPGAVVVRPGRRTATVDAVIEPGFVGTVRLAAAAAGTVHLLALVVRPAVDCARR